MFIAASFKKLRSLFMPDILVYCNFLHYFNKLAGCCEFKKVYTDMEKKHRRNNHYYKSQFWHKYV